MAQEMGDLTLGVECIPALTDVNDREEIRTFARGVNDSHAPRVDVEAQLLHAVRRGLNKLVLGKTRYPQGWLRVTEHEVARVGAALNREADPVVVLGHHIIIHEGGVMSEGGYRCARARVKRIGYR